MINNVVQLSRVDVNDVRQRVRAEMTEHRLSQSTVCRETGLDKSLLSQWLNDKYPGDNEAAAKTLAHWLEARQTRAQTLSTLPAAPAWIDTPSSRQILSALSYAQMAGDLSVIYGGAGVGKTSTALQYQRTAPSVWIATMTPSTAGVGTCLERLAITVGLKVGGHTRPDRMEAELIERLRNTQGLLIVDEAQHLSVKALDNVRSIQDAAGVGLVFMGNEVVYTQLTGGNRTNGFAQLFSRIGKRVRLGRPQAGDVDALLNAWGIQGKAERKILAEIAGKPGALRGTTKVLRLAAMFAAGDSNAEGRPGVEHIRAAWRDLGGEA